MEVMSDIRSKNMFTFPVSTISLLRKEGNYDLDSLDGFEDPEFAEWAIKHNMKWSDSNIFQDTSVNSLSNCCRLKSDIRDLGYFNSIGGTALKVGSVKVSTINLARLALDCANEDEYLEELRHRTLVNVRALDVVRHIIKRDVEKGLLPNFSYGLVDFEHLYNTIGFIGVYETMKKFGYTREDEFGNVYYTDEAASFGEKIFKTMREVADDFIKTEQVDYMINTEQIPGESAAAKLMKKDKFFYPDADIYDLPLYGNQFIPLGITTTLQERVRIQAMFDSFCNGGSILHANIDAPFDSFEKALRMTNYIAQQGVTYFAFNTKIQACEDNHAFYGTTCPTCGKPIATEYTRIVGFYTPVKTWSKERTKEYSMRRWININKEAANG
jgi:ribonucleoside-triphosphate reductase